MLGLERQPPRAQGFGQDGARLAVSPPLDDDRGGLTGGAPLDHGRVNVPHLPHASMSVSERSMRHALTYGKAQRALVGLGRLTMLAGLAVPPGDRVAFDGVLHVGDEAVG